MSNEVIATEKISAKGFETQPTNRGRRESFRRMATSVGINAKQ